MNQKNQPTPNEKSVSSGSRLLSNLVIGTFSGLIVAAAIGIGAWSVQYLSELRIIELVGGVDKDEFMELEEKIMKRLENLKEEIEEDFEDEVDELWDGISKLEDDLEFEDNLILKRLDNLESFIFR